MNNEFSITILPDGSRVPGKTPPTASIAEMLHAKNPAAFGKLVGALLQSRLLSPASAAGQNGAAPPHKSSG